jgi:hypothetical protein
MLLDELKGSIWSLISYQSEDKDGEINYPLGDDAKGYIAFTEQNILSVQLMAADREKEVSTDEIEKMNTPVEQQMAEKGYHAYSGPFEVDEEAEVLITSVELSLVADYIGSKQRRKITLDGNKLHLSNTEHPERKLVWEKVE